MIVCAPQSVYTVATCWMVAKGFAGLSLIVRTRTPSQPVGFASKRAPAALVARAAPHAGLSIVRSTARSSRSGMPFPFRSQRIGSFCCLSHVKSLTSTGAAGIEMLKIRTPLSPNASDVPS